MDIVENKENNSIVQKFINPIDNSEITCFYDGKLTWFIGVEIAKLLGYKNPRDTINKKVKPKYKSIKSEINVVCKLHTTQFHPDTTFINESGVYQLIMSSKIEKAELFQDWVYEDLLPTIHKTGEYKLQRELENKEKELQEHQNLIKQKELEYECITKENIEKDNKIKALELSNKTTLQLVLNMRRYHEKVKGHIYIVTNDSMKLLNEYKLGFTTIPPDQRLAQYNTGSKTNKFYYVYLFEIEAPKELERRIKNELNIFKSDDDKDEVYIMN